MTTLLFVVWLEYDTETDLLTEMKKKLGGKLPGVDLVIKKMSRSTFRKFAMRSDSDLGLEIAEVFGNLQDAYMEISDKHRKMVTTDRKDLSQRMIKMMDIVIEDYRVANLIALKNKDNVIKEKDQQIKKIDKMMRRLYKTAKEKKRDGDNVIRCKEDLKEDEPIMTGMPEIIYKKGESISRNCLFSLYSMKCNSGDITTRFSRKRLTKHLMKITGTPDQAIFNPIFLNLKLLDEDLPEVVIVSDEEESDEDVLDDLIILEDDEELFA